MIDTSHTATLQSPTPMTTPDEASPDDFAAVADAQSRALSRTVGLAGAALTVALWPFDLLVRASSPRAAHILFAMRLELLALYAAFFAASWALGRRVGGVLLAVPPAVLATGVFGLAIGQLARDDNYWFTSLYMLPMLCMPLLMPLGQRIVVAALCVATPLAGFALSFDGALSAVHVAHALGLFFMAATFGVYAGDVYYRHAREAFGLRRALEVRRAERRRLASDLHDNLGQELTAMRLEVETLSAVARDEPAASRVKRVAGSIERSHRSVRLMLESLRPRILDDDRVEPAGTRVSVALPTRSPG
ncbi:MAG: hypothetical protein KA978_07560 [Deltaproteobacteria bacterium]|nr:hypothetical protein [Deltaproteobacteria bacterium]